MKYFIIAILLIGAMACSQNTNYKILQNCIDSLQSQLANTYKPGFGEFMSGIQAHHSKLWFAGQNENWKLADFEIHEIMEAVENIQKFQTERKESQKMQMITPALDSINIAIQQKNPGLFKSSYLSLTNTCNNCHKATDFEFNVVMVPSSQPFSNQDFRAH